MPIEWLTLPILLLGGMLGFSVIGLPAAIDLVPVSVPAALAARGYSAEVVTLRFLRDLNAITLAIDPTRGQEFATPDHGAWKVRRVEDGFAASSAVVSLRQALGLATWSIRGQIVQDLEPGPASAPAAGGRLIFSLVGERADGSTITLERSAPGAGPGAIDGLVAESALALVGELDPYLVAVYHYRREKESRQFPNTLAWIERGFARLPRARDHHKLYRLWARTLRDQGQETEAIARYRQAVELQPEEPHAWVEWGQILVERGEYEQGMALIEHGLKRQPTYVDGLSELGNALEKQGEPAAAAALYRKALGLQPDFIEASVRLAALELHDGRPDAALALLQQAQWHAPDDPRVNELSGQILEALSARPSPGSATPAPHAGSAGAAPAPKNSKPEAAAVPSGSAGASH